MPRRSTVCPARPLAPELLLLTFCVLSLGGIGRSRAETSATILRQGSFETLTSVGGDHIDRFLLSADGSAVLYMVTEAAEDARHCFTRQQLRRLEIADGSDVVVEQGFTYDTGVGQGCASSLWFVHFDLSDDGTKIAYIRLYDDPIDGIIPQLVYCAFSTITQSCSSKTVILEEKPWNDYGLPGTRRIEPLGYGDSINGEGALVLSGDGQLVFYRDKRGPCGAPPLVSNPSPTPCFTRGGQGGSTPAAWVTSGETIYQVTAAGVASVVLEAADLELVPGTTTGVARFDGGGIFDVDLTGETLVSALSFSTCCGWKDLIVVDTAQTPQNAEVVAKNDDCCGSAEPSISADGRTVAFARRPTASYTGGLHVQRLDAGLAPSGPPVIVDPKSTVERPCLSGDGGVVGLFDNENSRAAMRWVPTDGSVRVPVSKPAIAVLDNDCRISQDGGSMLMYGQIRTKGLDLTGLPKELLLFRWQVGLETPVVTSVAAEPTVWLARDPYLTPWMVHTYFWSVSFSVGGHQVERAYSFPYDGSGRSVVGTFYGTDPNYGFQDNGAFPDRVAADGVYTHSGISLDENYPSADPLYPFPDDDPVLRVGVAASNGTATHADILVRVFPEAVQNSQAAFGVGDTNPWTLGTTGVTLDFSAHDSFGWLTARLFDYAPPDSLGSIASFWQLYGGEPQGHGGPPLGNYVARATFEYAPADLAAAGFDEGQITLWHTLDCVTWVQVPSTVDAAANKITTAVGQTELDGIWTIGAGAPVFGTTIFVDGFESGNAGAWSATVP